MTVPSLEFTWSLLYFIWITFFLFPRFPTCYFMLLSFATYLLFLLQVLFLHLSHWWFLSIFKVIFKIFCYFVYSVFLTFGRSPHWKSLIHFEILTCSLIGEMFHFVVCISLSFCTHSLARALSSHSSISQGSWLQNQGLQWSQRFLALQWHREHTVREQLAQFLMTKWDLCHPPFWTHKFT